LSGVRNRLFELARSFGGFATLSREEN
jgi:hypothetical protein